MTLNFPGPYEIRLFYTTTVSSVALSHVAHYSLDLVTPPNTGDAFTTIIPKTRAFPAGSLTLDQLITTFVDYMKVFYSSGGGNTIDRAELWKYTEGTFDGSFVSAKTLGVAGTSGSAVASAGQSIVTMRTGSGGIFKYSFMESVISAGVTDTGTISNTGLENMVADLEAGNPPWLGRDGSYPFVRIAHYPGQNEKLFKLRNRP